MCCGEDYSLQPDNKWTIAASPPRYAKHSDKKLYKTNANRQSWASYLCSIWNLSSRGKSSMFTMHSLYGIKKEAKQGTNDWRKRRME